MEAMTRISIPVSIEEREALRTAAEQRMLDPRVHARYILRRALFGKSPPSAPTIRNSKPAQVLADAGGFVPADQ